MREDNPAFRAGLRLLVVALLLCCFRIEASPGDGQIEEFLLHGKVVKSEEIGVGVTDSRKLLLEYRGETMSAAFKTIDIELLGTVQMEGQPPRAGFTDRAVYERAAYLVDRFLGLDMVPVTVMRTIDDQEGAVIYWIPDAIRESERREKGMTPPDPGALEYQKELRRVFDVLIGNEDRNQGNELITPADWKLHLIDHSRAFRRSKRMPDRFLDSSFRPPPAFYERLLAVDRESMFELLDGVLDKYRIKALVVRRDRMIEKFERDFR